MTSLYERDASVPPAAIAPYRSTKTPQEAPPTLVVTAKPAHGASSTGSGTGSIRDEVSYNELIITASITVISSPEQITAME